MFSTSPLTASGRPTPRETNAPLPWRMRNATISARLSSTLAEWSEVRTGLRSVWESSELRFISACKSLASHVPMQNRCRRGMVSWWQGWTDADLPSADRERSNSQPDSAVGCFAPGFVHVDQRETARSRNRNRSSQDVGPDACRAASDTCGLLL